MSCRKIRSGPSDETSTRLTRTRIPHLANSPREFRIQPPSSIHTAVHTARSLLICVLGSILGQSDAPGCISLDCRRSVLMTLPESSSISRSRIRPFTTRTSESRNRLLKAQKRFSPDVIWNYIYHSSRAMLCPSISNSRLTILSEQTKVWN
jgi:hypothetical protein